MLRLINKYLAELYHKWRDKAMAKVELLKELLESLKTKHGYKRMCEKLEKEIAKCQN
jgi:hypothetical protein